MNLSYWNYESTDGNLKSRDEFFDMSNIEATIQKSRRVVKDSMRLTDKARSNSFQCSAEVSPGNLSKNVNDEVNQMKRQFKESQVVIFQLQQQCSNYKSKLKQLQQELHSERNYKSEQTAVWTTEQNQKIQQYQQKYEKLKGQIERKNAMISELEMKNQELKLANSQLNFENQELSQQNKSVKGKIDNEYYKIKQESENLIILNHELQQKNNQLELKIKKDEKAQEQQLQNVQDQLQQKQMYIQQLEKALQECRQQKNQLMYENEQLAGIQTSFNQLHNVSDPPPTSYSYLNNLQFSPTHVETSPTNRTTDFEFQQRLQQLDNQIQQFQKDFRTLSSKNQIPPTNEIQKFFPQNYQKPKQQKRKKVLKRRRSSSKSKLSRN